jgi:hypothetical protein
MIQANLYVVKLRIPELLSHMLKRMLELIHQMLWVGSAIVWGTASHVCAGSDALKELLKTPSNAAEMY